MTEATSPLSIERLAKHHDVEGFDCGKTPLNDFLTKHALQNQVSGGARTYVLVRGSRVVGYYSLAPAMEASPTNPLYLHLLFKDIRHSLDAAQKNP
jgi:hypothetical protein